MNDLTEKLEAWFEPIGKRINNLEDILKKHLEAHIKVSRDQIGNVDQMTVFVDFDEAITEQLTKLGGEKTVEDISVFEKGTPQQTDSKPPSNDPCIVCTFYPTKKNLNPLNICNQCEDLSEYIPSKQDVMELRGWEQINEIDRQSKIVRELEKEPTELYPSPYSQEQENLMEKLTEPEKEKEPKDCRTCEYQIIFDYLHKSDEFEISCSIGQVNWKKCQGKYYDGKKIVVEKAELEDLFKALEGQKIGYHIIKNVLEPFYKKYLEKK